MSWKSWFAPERARDGPSGAGRLPESILSVKIVVILIVTIFIPSILITVLGILAVYRAEPILRQWVEYPVHRLLFELDQKLIREWEHRLRHYESRIAAERSLHRYLLGLLRTDEHVEDAIVFENGDFVRLEAESPIWRLETPLDDPALAAAWDLEFRRKDLAAARAEYAALLEASEAEIEVEALAGHARVAAALGEPLAAVESLERLVDRYGMTDDGSGIPRALPALWRIVTLHIEAQDLVRAAVQMRRFVRTLAELRPWLGERDLSYYRGLIETYRRDTRDGDLEYPAPEIPPPSSRLLLRDPARQALRRHASSPPADRPRGFLRIDDDDGGGRGRAAILAWFRVAGADRVVYLVLQPQTWLEDARLFTRELGIADRLLRFEAPSPGGGGRPADDGALVSRPVPAPFEDHWLHYYPMPEQVPQHLENLETLKGTGFVWGIVVLTLTILLGIMITLRSILREMQISRLKSDFVSFVSHELKTPLTSIRMITETLLMGRAGDAAAEKECVEIIDKEAARLSRLIDQILEFSRLERRQLAFKFTVGDMSEVVQEAVRIFGEQCPDRSAVVEVHQAQKMSRIRMDRSAMVELLLNLITNAHKYSRGRDHRIVINLRESIDNIYVDVVDFGIGIPKGEQRKIFEKFYRAQDYLTRDIEGTGLGLTFARYVAKVHDGDIKVTSAVNQGSTFTLELRKTQVHAE